MYSSSPRPRPLRIRTTRSSSPASPPTMSIGSASWGSSIGRRCRDVSEADAAGLRGRLHGRQRHLRQEVHPQSRPQAARSRQVLRLAAREVARHLLPDRPVRALGRRGGPAGHAHSARGQRGDEAGRLDLVHGLPGGGRGGVRLVVRHPGAGRRDLHRDAQRRRVGDRNVPQAGRPRRGQHRGHRQCCSNPVVAEDRRSRRERSGRTGNSRSGRPKLYSFPPLRVGNACLGIAPRALESGS